MKMVGFAFVFCLLVSGNVLYGAESALTTTFIDDLCYNTKFVEYNLKYEPSGILMGVPRNQGPFECEVVFVPPQGASVVLSIHRYDLYADDVLTIEDSDRHRVALMGYGVFKDEKKSVISEGKLRIRYKTNGNNTDNRRAGFQFTFTRALKSPCNSNEFKCANEHCIQKSYVCDGHNHCGDLSDQKKCSYVDPTSATNDRKHSEPQVRVLFVTLFSLGCLILIIVIIVFTVYMVKGNKLRKAIAKNQNPANSVPLGTVSSSIPQASTIPRQPAQNPTVHGGVPQGSVPVQNHSLYERVRHSFRGARASPSVETVAKQQPASSYHVPSMYPSLDFESNAPGMHGVDNSDFRIDE